MDTPLFSLSPKRAVGLTGWFLLYQVGLCLLAGLVVALANAMTGRHFLAGNGVDPTVLILVNSTAAFLVLRLQLRKSQLPWREFFRPAVQWVRFLPALLLIMIGGGIVVSEIENWMQAIAPIPQLIREYIKPLGDLAAHPLSAPFALVVVASMSEEFVFRGLILRGLLGRIGSGPAIVVSAGLFALVHLNPWQVPGAFFGGVLLGWVYLRTRSLTLCIAGHGFHNAVSLLAAGLPFTVDGFNRDSAPGIVLFQPWWFNLLGVALLVAGIYWVKRTAPSIVWAKSEPPAEPPLLPNEAKPAAVIEETLAP